MRTQHLFRWMSLFLLMGGLTLACRDGWSAPIGPLPAEGVLFINEWLASNGTGLRDSDGDLPDWIELFNAGPTTLDLGGMHLTDTLLTPTKWTFPVGVVIPPRGFLVVFASSKDRSALAELHTNFQLAGGGERIGLFAADGVTVIDAINFGPQQTDISQGRYPDGAEFLCFMTPTPWGPNVCGSGSGTGCVGIDCPGNITLDCQPPGGAPVYYSVWATNACAPGNPVYLSCSLESGAVFPIGTSAVECKAASFNGQFWETNWCTFVVTLRTNCPPTNCVDILCPPDITVACQGTVGTPVPYTVTAANRCFPMNQVFVTCTPPPGTVFPPGTTTVDCYAVSEVAGGAYETNHCSFTVTVLTDCPLPPGGGDCHEPGGIPIGSVSNPWIFEGMLFSSTVAGGGSYPDTRIDAAEGYPGYFVPFKTKIILAQAVPYVTIDFIQRSGWVEFRAFDEAGAEVVIPAPLFLGVTDAPQRVGLVSSGRPIKHVEVLSPNGRMNLIGICWGVVPGTTSLGPYSALGNANLGVWPEGGLAVSNLVTGGGLRVDLAYEPELDLNFDGELPATTLPSGARFDVVAWDAQGLPLGSIYATDVGSFYRVLVSLGSDTTGAYRAEVYDENQLTGSFSNLTQALWLSAQPTHLQVRIVDGFLQMVLGWDTPQQFQWERTPNLGVTGTRIALYGLAPIIDVSVLRYVDIRWSEIFLRRITWRLPLCLDRILVPEDIHIYCASPGSEVVYLNVVVTNDCLRTSRPALLTGVPSGNRFAVGCHTVTVTADSSRVAPATFQVCVSREGCFLENGSFEVITPPGPAGGRVFSGVSAWSAVSGDVRVYGAGSSPAAHSGVTYAGLAAASGVGGLELGILEGTLNHRLDPGPFSRAYVVTGYVASAASGRTLLVSLRDSVTGTEQAVGAVSIVPGAGWRLFKLSVTAARPFDRVRLTDASGVGLAPELRYVFVDDLGICCGSSLGITGCDGILDFDCHAVRWSGSGVLQSATSVETNAVWEDVKWPVEHHLNEHRVTVPAGPNLDRMFFRLRSE